MMRDIPPAPLCSVHGLECRVTEESLAKKQTKAFIHTHSNGPPIVYVCPSACEVCNPKGEAA